MTVRQRLALSATIRYCLLIIFSLWAIFPILWMISTSIKPESEILTSNPSLIPHGLTLGEFKLLITNMSFLTYIKNSMITASCSAFAALVISVFAAYALSRYRLVRTVSFVGRLMFIAQMTPPVLLVIPIYIIMGKLGLLNTYAALIITYTSFSVPVSSWILKSYFDNLPIDMEESALLDGCSRTGALLRIVLPVSLPSLVATAVYTFVLAWSDFLFGFTLISTNNMRPATSELGLLEGLWTVQWGQLMAGSVLCIIPVVIVFVVFQRYFVNGLLLGATKG